VEDRADRAARDRGLLHIRRDQPEQLGVIVFDAKLKMPAKNQALPGRAESMPVPERHYVNGATLRGPFPAGSERALFGLGCFWGAERKFWELPGVITTAVGYAGTTKWCSWCSTRRRSVMRTC
jgi:hypothetical protein